MSEKTRRVFPALLILVGVCTLAPWAAVRSAPLYEAGTGRISLQAGEPMAPKPNFRHVDERDGLSHPAVYGIAQDAFGFMWLATVEGVDRYDGFEMRSFRPDPQAAGITCGGPKVSVFVDSKNRIWIGSIGRGACSYDTLSGEWRAYFADGTGQGMRPVMVRDFVEDETGTIWMATSAGLGSLAPGSETPSLFINDPQNANSLVHDDVYGLALDDNETLWIGTRGGVSALNRATRQFATYQHAAAGGASLSSDRVLDVLVDRSGAVWIATWDGGLNRLDPSTGAMNSYRYATDDPTSLGSDQVMKLLEDTSGRLWIGTYGGGLNLFDVQSGLFERYQNDVGNRTSLSHNNVVALFEDSAGMLWTGTEGGGINILNLRPQPFEAFLRSAASSLTIAPGLVLALAEDGDGRLLIGTNAGGVSRLDRSSGAISYWQADANVQGSLASNVVSGLLYDSQGVLWVGTSKGLNRYDASQNEFVLYEHDPNDPKSLSDNSVYQILEDGDGTFWIGTYGGLNHFDPATGLFTRYTSDSENAQALSSNLVRVLLRGADDELWIGTQGGGLNRLLRSSGAVTHFTGSPSDSEGLSSNGITGLARDGEGMIWVGTDDGGLNRLDPFSGDVTRLGVTDGLADPRIMALVYVADTTGEGPGSLWMSTGRGLSQFDLGTWTFRNYDSSDGLPDSDFVPYSVYRAKSGELFFGGLDGFVAFQPDQIAIDRVLPSAQVAELYINNRPAAIGAGGVLPTAIFASDVISLPADSQAVTFLFSTPGYRDARTARFRFRLEGFESDWVQAQLMQRAATYTNMGPGVYRFHLQAAGRDGIWNEPGRVVTLNLQPAWWQLWWVRPLAGLAAIGLLAAAVLSVFQTRLRLSKRRNEILEKEVAARTTELSALLAASQSITSERNLDPLLVRVLDYVSEAIPHAGSVLLLRNGSEDEVQAYSVCGERPLVEKSSVPGEAFRSLAAIVGSGRLFDPSELNGSAQTLRTFSHGSDWPADRAAEEARWIAAPLVEHGEVIGSLLLYDTHANPFDEDELPKLQRFANQLAIAVENARLKTQAQRLAVDLERSRLSRELHDSVTQLLHSISLHANAAERALALGRPAHGAENMRQAQHLAQEAIHELRTLIFELRLTPLEEGGLQAALKAYLDTVVARSGLAVHLSVRTQQRWPRDVEFELYRIAQEALTNVVKHAHASRVSVTLFERCNVQGAASIVLEIIDNGRGFDVAAAQGLGTVGLQSMAERAQKIGACLAIRSNGGHGTSIQVELGSGTKPDEDTGVGSR